MKLQQILEPSDGFMESVPCPSVEYPLNETNTPTKLVTGGDESFYEVEPEETKE